MNKNALLIAIASAAALYFFTQKSSGSPLLNSDGTTQGGTDYSSNPLAPTSASIFKVGDTLKTTKAITGTVYKKVFAGYTPTSQQVTIPANSTIGIIKSIRPGDNYMVMLNGNFVQVAQQAGLTL